MRGTRRSLLASMLLASPALLLMRRSAAAQAPSLEPTPECADADEPTPATTAGPFYRPASPLKRNLRADVTRGEPIDLAGFVLDTHCRPMRDAVVEIWHVDDSGDYDNKGFRLRGHQRTGADGRWRFDTIVTRAYANRTAHYHFRVVPPAGRALVTQLFFPDHPRNARDSLFDARLQMRVSAPPQPRIARFDFVLRS